MPQAPQRWQSATDCAGEVDSPPEFPFCSSEIHFGHHVDTGPKLQIGVLSRLDDDLHGNSLDYLHVIASGILRWKQAEKRACRSSDAVHMAFVHPPVGIDVKVHGQSRTYVTQLRLFEVRGHPDFLKRNNCEQLLAGHDV